MDETLRIDCRLEENKSYEAQQINVSSESVDYAARKELLDSAAALDKEDAFGRLVLPRDSYKKRVYKISEESDILDYYRKNNAEFRELTGEAYEETAAALENGLLSVGFDYKKGVHFGGHVIFDHQWDTVEKFFKHFRGVGVVADQVGMGKTIEAGMIMSELAERGLIKSVLIVASSSASLLAWQQEMFLKFGALFVKATKWEQLYGALDKRFSKAIILQDTFAQAICGKYINDFNIRREDSYADKAYDLIIIDESHKLNSDVVCGQKIFRCLDFMMEAKWKRGKPYCVLISGTPHKADMMSLYPLMKIVRRDLFNAKGSDKDRINKETFVRYCYGAKSLTELLKLNGSGGYDSDTDKYRGRLRYADFINRFMIRHTRRQLEANVAKSSENAADKVFKDKNSSCYYFFPINDLAAVTEINSVTAKYTEAKAGQKQLELLDKAGAFDSYDTLVPEFHGVLRDYYNANPDASDGVTSVFKDGQRKRDNVCAFYAEGKKPTEGKAPSKEYVANKKKAYFEARLEKLTEIINLVHKDERVIVFFESVVGNSVGWQERKELCERLPALIGNRPVLNATEKNGRDLVERFSRKENDAAVLLANSVCDQSVNLQFCRVIVNFSISKSPMVMDQRIGRIDRIGQKDSMYIYSFADVSSLDGYLLRFYNENLDLFSKWNGDIIMATACDDANTTVYKCDSCARKRRANSDELNLNGLPCVCGGHFAEEERVYADARDSSASSCGGTESFFEFTPAALACSWHSDFVGTVEEISRGRFVCSEQCAKFGEGCGIFRRGEQKFCNLFLKGAEEGKTPNSCRGCVKLGCYIDIDLNEKEKGLSCPKCVLKRRKNLGTGRVNSLEPKKTLGNDFESYVKQLWREPYFYDNFSAEVENIYNIVRILGNAEE